MTRWHGLPLLLTDSSVMTRKRGGGEQAVKRRGVAARIL